MSELFRIYGYISLARASTKERVYGAPLQIRKEKEEEEEERKRKRTMREKRGKTGFVSARGRSTTAT